MRPRAMLSATAMVTGLAVAVVGLAACASAQPQMSAAEAIEKRKALMKEQGAAWRNVQDKAKAGQIQAIVPDAEKLVQTAKQIPALFPEGSLDPAKSAAKPEIWQKKSEFDAAAKNLETLSIKLKDTAATGNAEQTQALVKDFGRQACGTCHQPFRVPPKQ
jgi:cytochrome c556